MNPGWQPLDGHPHVSVAVSDTRIESDGRLSKIRLLYIGPGQALIAAGVAKAEWLMPEAETLPPDAKIDDDCDQYQAFRRWHFPLDAGAPFWRWAH